MNTEIETEESSGFRDVELPHGCVACGGPLLARVGAGTARGVCRSCRRVSALTIAPANGGLRIAQPAGGLA